MKQAIYKYEIGFLEDQTIHLPCGADIVRIDVIDGRPYLWALVCTKESMNEPRRIVGLKTGAEVDHEDLVYIDCAAIHVQMELMLYFFEVLNVR